MDKPQINIEVINNKEMQQLFGELINTVKNRIVIDAIKKAAKPIVNATKSNLLLRSNIKKATGDNGVKIRALNNGLIGVRVGIANYKLRLLNNGTINRMTGTRKSKRKAHSTGKIKKTLFFTDAVKATKKQSEAIIDKSIQESMVKTVRKYNKK